MRSVVGLQWIVDGVWVVPCLDCGGSGIYWWYPEPPYDQCVRCKGRGYALVTPAKSWMETSTR